MNNGKKNWYIVDGWIPVSKETENRPYEGHEALIVLNCNPNDAEIFMDFYFEDKEPIEGVKFTIPAKRVKCFRMDRPEDRRRGVRAAEPVFRSHT